MRHRPIMMHFDTLPRSRRSLPKDAWLSERYEEPYHYRTLPTALHGEWETVQRSAQRVPRYDPISTRSVDMSDQFSDLGIYTDRQKLSIRHDDDEKLYDLLRKPDWSDRDYSRRYHSSKSIHRKNGFTQERDTCRYTPIPVEHIKTVQEGHCNPSKGERHYNSHRSNEAWRKNSCEFIELSDDSEEEVSLSDEDSDCDIYPFTLRNLNNNAKQRNRKISKRSEPYSLRKSSPQETITNSSSSKSSLYALRHSASPHSDTSVPSCSYRSRPSTSYKKTTCIDLDDEDVDDVICVSDKSHRSRKMDEQLKSTSSNAQSSNHQGSAYLKERLYPQRILTQSDFKSDYQFEDKYDLIDCDKESDFSCRGYQFSDEENGVIDMEDYEFCKESRTDKVDSKKSVHSKNTDNGIVPTPSYPAYDIIKDMIKPDGRQVDYVRGDGNCLFRALSKVIYNTESCHEELRQAIVDLMEKYPKDFEQFIDEKSFHLHIISMRKDGTWGTQAEIYGAATLLQRDIYILSPDPSGQQYRWLLFSPRFKLEDVDSFDSCYITLCHTNGNHYDRIAPLIGKCNCHLMAPELSGIRDDVDLTNEDLSSLIV